MTAHLVFEELDPGIPATLSRRVITGLLREELGYDGVVISDDLEMKAVAKRWTPAEIAVSAAGAGADILEFCHDHEAQVAAMEGLIRAAEAEEIALGTLPPTIARSLLRGRTRPGRWLGVVAAAGSTTWSAQTVRRDRPPGRAGRRCPAIDEDLSITITLFIGIEVSKSLPFPATVAAARR